MASNRWEYIIASYNAGRCPNPHFSCLVAWLWKHVAARHAILLGKEGCREPEPVLSLSKDSLPGVKGGVPLLQKGSGRAGGKKHASHNPPQAIRTKSARLAYNGSNGVSGITSNALSAMPIMP